MTKKYDAVVIGTGGLGSSALLHLADRGLNCLGIEQFTVAHSRGSSHGETRAIRKAYFEHPSYVPLLHAAYDEWEDIERRCQEELPSARAEHGLFNKSGLLEIGPPDGILVSGIRKSVAEHGLQLEEYEGAEFDKRFPGFSLPEGSVALFEPDGGFLHVEKCVYSCCMLAQKLGAELLTETPVLGWQDCGTHFEVALESEKILTKHLVVTAGAWTAQLLETLGCRLQVTRKQLHWFEVTDAHFNESANAPVFFYQTPTGFFYGFPSLDGKKMKIAEHSGGEPIAGPQSLSTEVDQIDLERVQRFIPSSLDGVKPHAVEHSVCMYTLSPDEHFIVDTHPDSPRLAFAAGMSGHGFKFASVFGKRLVQLAMGEERDPAMNFFRATRFETDS